MDEKPAAQSDVEIDVGALISSLIRRLPYIVVFVGIVAVGTYVALDRIAPVYKSEATVLIVSGESDLTRTAQAGQPSAVPDKEAITSQIQLIRSRDVAVGVSTSLDLKSRPEFDPTLAPPSTMDQILGKIGLGKPLAGTVEDRVLKSYYSKLDVFAVDQSRVIGIDFSSTDPKLAAEAANAVADGYIAQEKAAKRSTTSSAADFLSSQIDDLRAKVLDAEGKVAAFRSQNDLFTSGGQTPTTLPQQQLADLNSELSKARADRATAQAKADQIRAALKAGTATSLSDVLNSPLIQNLVQQEVALKSQMAQLSATLLPQHPRVKELAAQIADIDKQIATETSKVLDSLDSDTRLAAAREDAINKNLADLKGAATKAGAAGVQLAALEREAGAERDLLDQYLRSYREAVAREQTDYLPADVRVVSRASVPLEPDFPKKVPMTAAASVAAAILAVAVLLLAELASGRPMRRISLAEPLPMMPRRPEAGRRSDAPAIEGSAQSRLSDDSAKPPADAPPTDYAEPTLAPALGGRIEESLQSIAADIVEKNAKRVAVTLADGSAGGRPLAALALARILARGDGRVALVDFHADEANAMAVGEGSGLKGLADVFDGRASFSEVLFRDVHSRVHYVPAGTRQLSVGELADDRLETLLSALTLTYDQVLLDLRTAAVGAVAPTASAAMVASEHAADDPRTERALGQLKQAAPDAEIHLLVIEHGTAGDGIERAKSLAVDA